MMCIFSLQSIKIEKELLKLHQTQFYHARDI